MYFVYDVQELPMVEYVLPLKALWLYCMYDV